MIHQFGPGASAPGPNCISGRRTPGVVGMTLRLGMVTIDTTEAEGLARRRCHGRRASPRGVRGVTLADPDGNEPCVSAHEHSSVPLES